MVSINSTNSSSDLPEALESKCRDLLRSISLQDPRAVAHVLDGADTDDRSKILNANNGEALEKAACQGNAEIVQLLVDRGAKNE